MACKRKYRCTTCHYEADVYEGKGLFGQHSTALSCPDCHRRENIVVGGVIGDVAPAARLAVSVCDAAAIGRTSGPCTPGPAAAARCKSWKIRRSFGPKAAFRHIKNVKVPYLSQTGGLTQHCVTLRCTISFRP